MVTISKLYPILRKTGLDDPDIQEFIGIIEDSVLKGLATKENLKETEIGLKENLKDTEIALKENLKDTEIRLNQKLHDTEVRLNQKLHDTEVRLIKWVIGLLIAQTSIIVAIIKLF
jgi:hypothetical protein